VKVTVSPLQILLRRVAASLIEAFGRAASRVSLSRPFPIWLNVAAALAMVEIFRLSRLVTSIPTFTLEVSSSMMVATVNISRCALWVSLIHMQFNELLSASFENWIAADREELLGIPRSSFKRFRLWLGVIRLEVAGGSAEFSRQSYRPPASSRKS